MGYTIQYGPAGAMEADWKKRKRLNRKRFLLGAAIMCAVICLLLTGNGERLQELLIPGNPEVTRAAFSQFTEDLRGGDSFGEAMTAFCREIIDNAAVGE